MKRHATIAVLIAAASLAHVSIASAQRWGRGATPPAGVCFYEDINFGGRYFCTPAGQGTESVPPGMNDRISSVKVFGNAAVTLYRDSSFRGQSRLIDSDAPDLRGLGFNDRISSYSVDARRGFNRNDRNDTFDGNARNRGRFDDNDNRRSYREAEAVVRRSYRSVLGREADASGLRSWTEQVIRNNWTRRDLENALRQSDEYRALRNDGNAPRGYRRRN